MGAKYSKKIDAIISEEIKISKNRCNITEYNKIPSTSKIPIDKPSDWLKIKDVICLFVDMNNSTKLSAENHANTTAKSYRLFTHTIIKILKHFNPDYIDIKGDGVFALFNSDRQYSALVSAVTCKTILSDNIFPRIKELTNLETGAQIGIDRKTILVRKMGLRNDSKRDSIQNEVWAGKTVNMAAKLGNLSKTTEIIVSDRFYLTLKNDLATKSCGCKNGVKSENIEDLWKPKDVTDDDSFDFDLAYALNSTWCVNHGEEYAKKLLEFEK